MNLDYSKLIKDVPINDVNIAQNLLDVQDYGKILSGNLDKSSKTKLLTSSQSLGRVYAYDTNETCVDVVSGMQVPRHSIVNSLSSEKGLLNSANADFNKAKSDIFYVTNNETFPMKCMSATINETDVYGKTIATPHYIMIAEINQLSDDLFPINAKTKKRMRPILPKIEKYVNMENMDIGQKFFAGSVAILGLYMYFKMVFGHAK
jgi:hypothetical protein